MVSLQNITKKIINDSIKLFLFIILKLLCSNFLYILSYFPSSVLNCVVSHILEQLYIKEQFG